MTKQIIVTFKNDEFYEEFLKVLRENKAKDITYEIKEVKE